jgi:hypothetical protein
MKASQADAAVMSDVANIGAYIYSSTPNAISVTNEINGDNAGMADFRNGYNARFSIKNSVGTVVKTGSLNNWIEQNEEIYNFYFRSNTNISLAGLPKNTSHYRIDITLPLDNGTYNSTNASGYTAGFTYNADGSVTNVRP